MEKHRKIYMEYFDLGREDFAPDEILGCKGSEIHHIFGRIPNERMEEQGFTDPNDIRNLMLLDRFTHEFYGQKESFDIWLFEQHLVFLERKLTVMERDPYDKNLALILPLYVEKFIPQKGSIIMTEEDPFETKLPKYRGNKRFF